MNHSIIKDSVAVNAAVSTRALALPGGAAAAVGATEKRRLQTAWHGVLFAQAAASRQGMAPALGARVRYAHRASVTRSRGLQPHY